MDDGRRRTIAQWEQYFEKYLPKEIPPSPGHPPFLFRRQVIRLVLDDITALGFARRRNVASHDDPDKRPSACAIVSKALERLGARMSEAAIVDFCRPLRQKKAARR